MRLAAFDPRVRTLTGMRGLRAFDPRVRTLTGLRGLARLRGLGCDCNGKNPGMGRLRGLGRLGDSFCLAYDDYGNCINYGSGSDPYANNPSALNSDVAAGGVSPTVVTATGQVMPTFSPNYTVNQTPPPIGAATATAIVPSSIPGGSTISVAPAVALQAAAANPFASISSTTWMWLGGGLLAVMLLGGGGKRR
jgi:hypothetical protein